MGNPQKLFTTVTLLLLRLSVVTIFYLDEAVIITPRPALLTLGCLTGSYLRVFLFYNFAGLAGDWNPDVFLGNCAFIGDADFDSMQYIEKSERGF